MPRKKATSPAESPEDKALNPSPETAAPAEPPVPPAPSEPETPAAPEPGSAPAPESPKEPAAASTAPSESACSPASEGRPAIATAAKGLNLREGPGFGFEVLTILERGTLVLVLDLPMGVKVPGWELVNTGERTGWVSDRFLRPMME